MRTNGEIETLNQMIKQAEMRNSTLIDTYKKRLQQHWNKIFDNDKQLNQDAINTQSASEYSLDDEGIVSWYRVKTDLKKYNEGREYLEEWLSDHYCLNIDWGNDCFTSYIGNDNIMIQDDTRRDNGVWQSHKLLFDESEYTDENGNIDLIKRNELIESHMEKTGYFPGVFRVTQYGYLYPVNTKEVKK